MMRCWLMFILTLAVLGSIGESAEAQGTADGFWHSDRNRIYGQDLMTTEERLEYRRQLWKQPTQAEKDRFRDRHRQDMQERARNRGLPLPDGIEAEGSGEAWPGGWPADGLRRWPEDRSQAQNGLRRWQPGEQGWSSAGGVRNWSSREPPENWWSESRPDGAMKDQGGSAGRRGGPQAGNPSSAGR